MDDKKRYPIYFGGLLFLSSFLLASCTQTDQISDQKVDSKAANIGWLHGNCLAIKNAGIATGTALTIVEIDEPQNTLATQVKNKTLSAEDCYALMDDRKPVNLEQGYSFYTITTEKSLRFGIGIVQRKLNSNNNESAIFDLNGDGVEESFNYCQTSEGIQFSVWKGKPFEEDPLWSEYYYLGYDSEPDCPVD